MTITRQAARSRPLGPARENDVSMELRGLQPVPGPERYGRPFRIFTMWLSPQFTPSALFIGVLAASLGLSFWQGLPAIVIGNIIGALVVAALCTWGPRTGMGQMPLSRAAFGKSNVLPGVVNWAATIGWVAFNNVFGAAAPPRHANPEPPPETVSFGNEQAQLARRLPPGTGRVATTAAPASTTDKKEQAS